MRSSIPGPAPVGRRAVLGAAAGLAIPSVLRAQARPIRLGVLTDLSSWGKANAGPGSVQAARMAVAETGGTVAGRPVEIVTGDHQMKVDVGSAIAREWFDRGGVQAILDVPNSAIGLSVHALAREKGRTALLSGSVSSDITGKLCSPNTVQVSLDTYAAAKAAALSLVPNGGRTWFFITADFAFGHALQADTTRAVEAAGGTVLGHALHPPGTTDFSSLLLQAQASGADVVALANSASDTVNAIKQSAEFGLRPRQQLTALLLFITDVHAIGLEAAQGVRLSTTSYWMHGDAAKAWSGTFLAAVGAMPTMTQAGTYTLARHFLRAAQDADPDDAAAIGARMRSLPVADAFVRQGRVRQDGRVIQDVLLARVKTPAEMAAPWDYYDVTGTLSGDSVFRPLGDGGCPLAAG